MRLQVNNSKQEGWQFSNYLENMKNMRSINFYRPFCKSIENIKKTSRKEFNREKVKSKKSLILKKNLKKNYKKNQSVKQLAEKQTESLVPDKFLNKDADASVLSLLSKIAPERVQEVAQGLTGNLKTTTTKVPSTRKTFKKVSVIWKML